MKKALVISLLVFSFILSSCSSPSSPTPQVDYQATVTSYSVDIASLTWESKSLKRKCRIKGADRGIESAACSQSEAEQTTCPIRG